MLKYFIIIIILAFPSFVVADDEKPIFEFKVSGAECGNPKQETSFKTKYKDWDVTTVVKLSINCAYVPYKPSYQLKQDMVVFSFETFSPSDAMARCVCDTTIIFRLLLNSERYSGIYKDIEKAPKVKVIMDGKEIIP